MGDADGPCSKSPRPRYLITLARASSRARPGRHFHRNGFRWATAPSHRPRPPRPISQLQAISLTVSESWAMQAWWKLCSAVDSGRTIGSRPCLCSTEHRKPASSRGIRRSASPCRSRVGVEPDERPQGAGAMVASLAIPERLIEGSLTRLIVGQQDLLANRRIRPKRGFNETAADPASLCLRMNQDILEVADRGAIADDSGEANQGPGASGCHNSRGPMKRGSEDMGRVRIDGPTHRTVQRHNLVDVGRRGRLDHHVVGPHILTIARRH